MDFLLFTYPNCQKCEALKKALQEEGINYQELALSRKESKLKIREFLGVLKRDEKGGIILPSLIVVKEENRGLKVLNSKEEFWQWWKSRE